MSHEKKRALSFFITSKCNLGCVYCVNDTRNSGEEKSISLDFAKAGIDDFFQKRTDIFGKGNRMIRFYGIGEPTTRMDLVRSITEYARKVKGSELFIELQSNGFFSHSTAKWIADNVNELWISIDGPREIQNRNRPSKSGQGTSDKVEKNIRYLLKRGSFVGTRSTIIPHDVRRQNELIDYFHSLGIKWVYGEPVFESVKQDGMSKAQRISPVNLMEYAKNFVKAYKYARTLGMHYGNFFTMNFDEPCKFVCRSCFPMPQLTADGFVSGCDLAYHGKTQLPEFIFGKFDKNSGKIEYFPERIAKIRKRTPDNLGKCKNCEIKDNCGGCCAGMSYFFTGDFMGVVDEFCELTKYFSKHLPLNEGRFEHSHP